MRVWILKNKKEKLNQFNQKDNKAWTLRALLFNYLTLVEAFC
jgi:hypothetical protein